MALYYCESGTEILRMHARGRFYDSLKSKRLQSNLSYGHLACAHSKIFKNYILCSLCLVPNPKLYLNLVFQIKMSLCRFQSFLFILIHSDNVHFLNKLCEIESK